MRLGFVVVVMTFLLACDDDSTGNADEPPTTGVAVLESPPAADCVDVPLDTPTRCPVDTHCGIGLFSRRVNDRWWMTSEGAGTLDYIPVAWGTYEDPPQAVTIVVRDGADPTLTASLNGHEVVYRPIPDDEFIGCA